MGFQPEIVEVHRDVLKYVEEYRLDPFPVIFELCDYDQLNEIAAYGGFPTRYPHWRFGMTYDHLSKGYLYGLQKIYELVINHDPCYAYLLRSNDLVDQKLVMAHVYAHSDFFKNNLFFKHTNRKMLEDMANHCAKIRELSDRYGVETVEGFLDLCLSVENLLDPYATLNLPAPVPLNKPSAAEKTRMEAMQKMAPRRDVLMFLMEYAPLKDWEIEILSMVREEAYYFAPQRMTKIMNEGWASYWHSKIMTEKALKTQEVIDYAEHHAGAVALTPGQINPYKLGIELFRDIEDRWDKGRFGAQFEQCGSYEERQQWNNKTGLGREKIFEVRRIYNDVSFIDTFLTEDFCLEQQYFTYAYNRRSGRFEIVDRDWRKVKEKMLFSLTNLGSPIVYAADNNYDGKGELLFVHEHLGFDLKIEDAKDTMSCIFQIWKKPVHLTTELGGQKKVLSFNGEEHRERNV